MSTDDGYRDTLPSALTFSTTHWEYQWAVRHLLEQLRRLLKERTEEYGDSTDAYVPWHRDVILATTSVQLYACLTVEAMLNFWAAVRLGMRRLKRIEPLGLESKLRCVVRRILEVELGNDDAMRQAVRRLAAARNDLVHPKAFAGGPGDHDPVIVEPPRLADAERAAADMQLITDFIIKSDSEMWSLIL